MPAPSNDAFASATALSTTLPGSLSSQTNVDATSESGEPLIGIPWSGAVGVQSVWYSFTPTSTGRYRFRLNGLTNGWTDVRAIALEVFSGSAVNALTELAQDSRTSSNTPNYEWDFWLACEVTLTSGTTYYIRVASPLFTGEPANRHTANFGMVWESRGNPSAPGNDDFANATDLGTDPADGLVASPTTVGATDDSGGFSGSNPNYTTVWYKFHCATTESQPLHCIRDSGDPYYIPYWELYRKLVATPTSWSDLEYIDCSEDLGSGPPYTDASDFNGIAGLVAGEDYFLTVNGYFAHNGVTGASALYFGDAPTLDNATVVLKLTASGAEFVPGIDAGTVYLDLLPGSTVAFDAVDAATVYLDLQVGSVDERVIADAATVYLDLQVLGGECFSTISGALLGEGEAELVMATISDELSMIGDADLEWTYGEVTVEGIDC